ncbi:RNA-binding La domain protein [Pyrenophora tritici-repentis]|nr:RNA-binding La domain protein [Pyrenophora tritici-repentis]KAI1537345.1 LHP1 La protein small RNA-binding pol III transcript stabilizing protein [Pyrenophora tritici-repentis]KAI1542480.1 LHP1 La protein small RNA-binding pol III transcript stabilizing protein [Pyrenophora tritici-repentis]
MLTLRRPHNREFEKLPESDDPEEIRSQVEFYFSRANLASDHHMFMETEGPKNKPVSIHHVCTFSRMRRFKPYSAVVAALRDSKDLVVVDDGEYSKPGSEAVKRREAITVPVEDGDDEKNPSTEELFYRLKNASSNNMATSVYAKGFGSEEESGQIALEKFFRPYGAVQVRMRREDNGTWKGSVFVEFDSEDSQKQFLALDPKPKFNDNELTAMGKQEYIEMKCAEKGIKPDHLMTEQEKDRDNRRRDRSGSVDENDWNKRRDRFKSGKNDRGSRKEEKKEIERDGHGVPIIKDVSDATSNKRKAETDDNEASPKKNKLEIKEDE